MRIVGDPVVLRDDLDRLRAGGARIGFVPTMGYLHEGHASLMRLAREHADLVVVSAFVNPTQFGPSEDLDRYPRDEARDEAICKAEGVELLFRPPVEAIYPSGPAFSIEVGAIGTRLCGASRPGHFDGVATVVAKLFNIVGPCVAVFGAKDAQQVVILERLASSFHFPVRVVRGPTIREADGVAMSSRNAYLSDDERAAAPVLFRALVDAEASIRTGVRDAASIMAAMRAIVEAEPLASIDYVACVDPGTLDDVEVVEAPVLLALAVRIGPARLIDNLVVAPPGA